MAFTIHQEQSIATDPWELGSYEDIGIGGFGPVPVQVRRRFPLQRTPIGDPPVPNRLKVIAETCGDPDCPTVECTFTNFVCADEIEPVNVIAEGDPPYSIELGSLHTRQYNKGDSGPAYNPSGECAQPIEMYCGTTNYRMHRWVLPICRIAGWPGWTLKLNVSGTVPWNTLVVDSQPTHDAPCRMRASVVHTYSWSYVMGEINPDLTLWGWDQSKDPCTDKQNVNFNLYFCLPWCDCVVDWWMVAAKDDGYPYNGHPVAEGSDWCDGPHLQINSATLEPPAP